MSTDTNGNYKIGKKVFSRNDIPVMGIINVTPDSFSDGGKYFNIDSACTRVDEMIHDGADIIDIGGESTRPGSDFVSAQEEMNRILPVIEKVKNKYPDVLVSADTSKSEVAKAALDSGADIINDISGGTFDNRMFEIVKKYNAAVIIMHIKGTPKMMQKDVHYSNLVKEVYQFLYAQSSTAKSYGIEDIFIDPGIGFGKTIDHNLELINRLPDFFSLGFPIVIGNSRKSFLGKITGKEAFDRDVASVIADTYAVIKGASIIRTHNVSYTVQLKHFYKAMNSYNV